MTGSETRTPTAKIKCWASNQSAAPTQICCKYWWCDETSACFDLIKSPQSRKKSFGGDFLCARNKTIWPMLCYIHQSIKDTSTEYSLWLINYTIYTASFCICICALALCCSICSSAGVSAQGAIDQSQRIWAYTLRLWDVPSRSNFFDI